MADPQSASAAISPIALVVVEWLDAGTKSGWHGKRQKMPHYHFQSVGWVMEDNAGYLHLAATIGVKNEERGDILSIPKGCITKVTAIAPPQNQ